MKKIIFTIVTLTICNLSIAQSIDTLNQIKNFSDFVISGTPNSSVILQSPNFSPLSFTLTGTNFIYKTLTSPSYTSNITYDSIVAYISTTNTYSISLTMYNAPFLLPFNLPVNQTVTYRKLNSSFISIPDITANSLADYPSSGSITFSNILVLGYYQNITNINNVNKVSTLFVFPNPNNGIFTISSKQVIQKIEVTNIEGQLLLSETTAEKTHQLNLTNFPQGIYFIKVGYPNGLNITKKVIVNP